MKLAARMSRLGSESAFEVLARAKALEVRGRSIVHLEIGEPDFATAPHIVEAACDALRRGATHYTAAPGIIELRSEIARGLSQRRGHEIVPEQVVVTPGAKPIMFYVILALAEEGTEVICPDPGFPIYQSVVSFAGARAVPLPLREERDFSCDADELISLINDRTRLIILNSPQNPTGGVIPRSDLARVAEIAAERDIPVLSDEIYERMVYDEPFSSIAEFPGMSTRERTIILHGFSKTYAMTGWRLGYGVMPLELADHVGKLMVNSNSCTAAATQWAGLAALQGTQREVDAMMRAFHERRDLFVAGLNRIPGISCRTPKGAFYAFANIRGTGMDSRTCARFFLEEAGVACLSGTSFGAEGEGFVRFSYANSTANLELALERIAAALAEH
ncbi:MAG: pyridoxal phosphate-dependent aminotransferase [Chloroflexi bacterium]|nr:pyridoxal phosphate-dependent aminotransferase [Chloroflexota bacterium]